MLAAARDGIADVLDAERVEWRDGRAVDTSAVLPDDGPLAEVVIVDAPPAGHFVVTGSRADVPPEHRRTARLVAATAARWLTRGV